MTTDVTLPSGGTVSITNTYSLGWAVVTDSTYGADNTGVADSTAAINAAASSGKKVVYIPPGTYKISNTITLPVNVSLVGAGIGETILDGSSAVPTGGVHIKVTAGTLTALPALSVSPSKGTPSITFASAPSVVADDVVVLYNATDFSWSNFRNYYREGEYCRPAIISGNVVTVQAPLASSYTAANITCYKFTAPSSCTIEGFTLKGSANTGTACYGIVLDTAVDCSLRDLRVYNCSYAQIKLQSCINVSLDSVVCQEDFVNTFSGDYGLLMANCQSVSVKGGYFASSRHGITMGGADAVGYVVNRYITIDGATVGTTGTTLQALDCHGNSEYINFINNNVLGSFSFGGNNIRIAGNNVRAHTPTNKCLYAAELSGLSLSIMNNLLENDSYHTSNGSFIDIGGNGEAWGVDSTHGGSLIIQGNRMNWGMTTFDGNAWHIKITNSGYAGTERSSIHIRDNTMTMTTAAAHVRGGYGDITISTNAAAIWDHIEISGNQFDAAGFKVHTATAGYSAASVVCENNVFRNGSQNGMRIQQVRDYIRFRNNVLNMVNYCSLEGVSASVKCGYIEASGNTFVNTVIDRANSSSVDMNIGTWYATVAMIRDNTAIENNEYIGVAANTSIVIGETLTGATSGATAFVYNKRSTTEVAIGTSRTGTFTNGENLNGSTSGASVTTYTASSIGFSAQNMLSFINADTVYTANNTHNRLTSNFGTPATALYPADAKRKNTFSANKGDAAYTFNATDVDTSLLWNTALTAARAVTLNTAGAWNGLTVRVVRGASATGAFNLNVGTGPLKALTAAGQWCDVMFDGTSWVLVANGSL